MKKNFHLRLLSGLLIATASLTCSAQTTFFNDNFNNGSTTNGISIPGGTPTASLTSYDIASTKAATTNGITPGQFRLALNSPTGSGFVEAQALFTTNLVSLNVPGDYIEIAVVFTNTLGTVFSGGTSSALWIGLYNSEAAPGTTNPPVPFAALANSGLSTTASPTFATGNCANWLGYFAQIFSTPKILTRPQQTGATQDSANQDLLGNNVGGGAFDNPVGTQITPQGNTTPPTSLVTGGTYTLDFRITLSSQTILTISNALYQGTSTAGTSVFSMVTTNASGANFLTTSFDGMGIGIRNSGTTLNPLMDISSVSITGQSTIPTGPPTIVSQPSPVLVATNGSCAFTITAIGDSVTYQWKRNGTNLTDNGNISGAKSSLLVISPTTTTDQLAVANGYYCAVSGAGGFTTNSMTNSLSLITATNLIWTDGDTANNAWIVNDPSTGNWQDTNGNPAVFNYGDAVTFDDTGAGGSVNLSNNFLSAASVTVSSTGLNNYTFQGTGSIAGPGPLDYIGSARLILNCNNTYTGGTLVSNATAYVYLQNYAGLGAGPVTLGLNGGQMEIVNSGTATLGIQGDLVTADNFNVLVDVPSTFGAVFLGNLAGTTGKTLTLSLGPTNTALTRVRAYGGNTVDNANLNLSSSQILFASYQSTGSQTYNGVISGPGAFMQKGNSTTLNGQNTYSGGTTPAQGAIGLGVSSVSSGSTLVSGPIGTGPLLLVPDSTTSVTGSGQIFAANNNNITISNAVQYASGTNNLTLIVGGANNLTLIGAYNLNGNDGLTTNTFTSRTIQNTNTAVTTISGVISDGGKAYGLTLTGNGRLALNAAETYTGPTTNSGGTLLVNSTLASSSIVVATNGFLGGTGTISAPVTVQQGGGVAPGNLAIGTLTINNSLTLLGGSTNTVKVNKGAGSTHDLVVANSIAYAGTLFATNLSGNINMSDTFHVFTAGSETGGFTNVVGTPGPGLAWSFSAASGTLSVIQGVNINPTNITFSVSSGNLNMSWPADHLGWTLEVQTNTTAVGLSTNLSSWYRIPNTSNVNSTNFPLVSTNNCVFYRLVYP